MQRKNLSTDRLMNEVLYWAGSGLFLTLYFMVAGSGFIQTFYFVSFLLPVAIGTAFVINKILIPQFYITGKLFYFFLYSTYLIIASLFFQNLIILASLLIFSSFQKEGFNDLSVNVMNLNLWVYILVLINAMIHLLHLNNNQDTQITKLEKQIIQNTSKSITVRYNRQNFKIAEKDILYIESDLDYVKIFIDSHDMIMTKMTLSGIQEKLSDHFIRTHRSYIVNRNKITEFNREVISISENQVPLSRTYRKGVVGKLEKDREK